MKNINTDTTFIILHFGLNTGILAFAVIVKGGAAVYIPLTITEKAIFLNKQKCKIINHPNQKNNILNHNYRGKL